MPDPTPLPEWAKHCPDLRAAALQAAGWPGGAAGQHQLLTRKLERLRDSINRGIAALASRPDPDLTLLLESVAKQLGEAMATAIQLDTVATIERNLPIGPAGGGQDG